MSALDLPGTVTEYGLGGNHKTGTAWKGLAQFDEAKLYRYFLERELVGAQPDLLSTIPDPDRDLCVIMFNPSTADAHGNDPTMDVLGGLARREGFKRISVVNLYSFRSSKPNVLKMVEDPVGMPHGHHALQQVVQRVVDDPAAVLLCAWGAHPLAQIRAREVVAELFVAGMESLRFRCRALYINTDGSPHHLLHLPGQAKTMPWWPTW